MKRSSLLLTLLLCLLCLPAGAQKITFMPQWTPQAQFAGYYVALEMGYYQEEGLDVEISHVKANARINPTSHLKNGEVDIITMPLLQAMVLYDGGTEVVNILQTSQHSGLCCLSHESVSNIRDLAGKSVGRWSSGYSEAAIMAFDHYDVLVNMIPTLSGIDLFIANALDAVLCYSYNELIKYRLATGCTPEEENLFQFSDVDYDFPEDGLYTTREYYETHKEALEKFVRASKRGWDYARKRPEKALDICMDYVRQANVSTNRIHQKMMLEEILRLQQDGEEERSSYARISEDHFNRILEAVLEAGLVMDSIDYNAIIK